MKEKYHKRNNNVIISVQKTIKRKTLILLFLILILGTGCGKEEKIYLDSSESVSQKEELQDKGSQNKESQGEDSDENRNTGIFVYVCGAVKNPGVYELESGKRVCDALKAAGGLREDAAAESLNQAQPVSDGQMVRVPVLGEEEQSQDGEDAADEGDGKININTASAQSLMELPGIGTSKAEAIIAYRQEHGAFAAVEDLMKISGIKEGVFQKIKDSVTVN